MATNTTATTQNHNGTGSQNNFAISFAFLANTEVDVKVGGVLKTLGTHYNIVGSQVQFTSGNTPPSGTANIVITRDTDISAKKVDFADGSVLTETDLDNNSDQILFAQQEFTNDFVKRDGSQTVTGNLVFEGATDDNNETTLAITDPTADRTITVPDITGTLITTADTGTVSNQMIAGDAVTNAKIADDSIDSEHYVDRSIDTQHISALQVTTNELGPDAVTSAKLADNSVNSEHYVDGSIDHVHLANDIIDGDNIQDDVINSEHYVAGSIDHEHLANDIIDGDNIQNDVINSEHYVAGSIDHEHLANDIIDGDNIQDDAIDNEHIAANAVRVNEIKDGEITSAKLNPSAVITESEQASATTNDTSFLTSAAADARFFNISTGDTIKDGQTFPDNDTTIATTAAINDRIIDLIDDVGGFTIIASEQAFPNVNPQGVTGQAAVLSIKAATTNLVPSGTTVTVANGNVADNANITITDVPTTIPSGFGFLVESTTTLHTYSFHRLVPKATEVTTVAGKAVEIGRLGTADAVADMAILGTTDVVADMNTLATADIVSDMNTLAVADVISDMNTLAVADVISDMDTVATNVTNVNNVGNNITNVNSVSNSAGANQTFTVTVQNVSGNKYFIDSVQTPVLKLARGKTYTFNLADSSNSGHPLAFRDSSDNSYTTGVTTNGTAGNSGATVVIVVAANAPSSLKYYCTSHGNSMGNTINVIDDNVGIVAGSISNVNTVGNAITNVNNVGGSITNVNTVATNISSVNSFANTYRIGASNPTDSLDVGDLFFNTTSDSLKVYTGSAWVDGVTATGSFAVVTGNTFTGSNIHNDNVKSIFGTSSDGLEIFHNGSDSVINDQGTGSLKLQTGGNTKIEITSTGTSVTGNIVVSGNVDGRDLSTDGTKLDGIETGATADQTASEIVSLLSDQNIATTGTLGSNDITITGTKPKLVLNDSNNENDFHIQNDDGTFAIKDIDSDTGRLTIASNGQTTISGNCDFSAGIDVTGNITVSGTVDGVDIAALNTTVGNISTEVVNDSSPQLGGDLASNGNDILMADNDKIKIGTGEDLDIYHSGVHSYIDNDGIGDLFIRSTQTNGDVNIRVSNGNGGFTVKSTTDEDMINAVANGAVELYYDNSKKFETKSYGAIWTGQLAGLDNSKVTFGNGDDLQIFHDGTSSIIKSASHPLAYYSNTRHHFLNGDGSENMAVFVANGQCELYHDNAKKFETASTGVQIPSTNDFRIAAGTWAGEYNGGIKIQADPSNSYFQYQGNLYFRDTGGSNRALITNTGNILPGSNNASDLGTSSYRWRNIYTNDLNLSNEGSSNDVDGTWGSYTIQEGEESLFLINKRNGKKYKFNLIEVS
tara:strand:- start:1177 stop:5232 length:4056 start_codon:yes stop_codon:yes gene_type:complete